MNKEELLRRARDPKYIPGIYNYCDRWCERCPFTSRCLNYDKTEEQYADPESRDINNKKFWEQLHESFKLTMELIQDTAEEEGIDLDAVATSEFEAQQERDREYAENHALAGISQAYAETVDQWFKQHEDLFKEKGYELSDRVRLTGVQLSVQKEVEMLKDAVGVIRWHQHQIYIKLMRALTGRREDREDEVLKDYPRDSDGSVKVALIGLDRSIASWGLLRTHFPEQREEILDILIRLDRIRKGTEKEFPEARTFKRPGFDYMPDESG